MTLLLQRLNTILRMVALLVHRHELSCCSLVVDAVRNTVLLPCTAGMVTAEAQTRQMHQVADADDQNVLLHCFPTNNMPPPPPGNMKQASPVPLQHFPAPMQWWQRTSKPKSLSRVRTL